jgi:hypothetical protein
MANRALLDKQNASYVESPTRQGTAIEVVNAESDLVVRIDDAAHQITYIGYAVAGSLPSAAVWKIKRIDESSGLLIEWADGNTSFDNVWDDRVSLTYI